LRKTQALRDVNYAGAQCLGTGTTAGPSDVNDTSNPRERRLVLRLLCHWRDLAADREMPRVSDVDGAAIPDLWPYCFMLDVRGAEPVFTFVGEYHVSSIGRDATGQPLSSVPAETLLNQGLSYYPRVLARAIPITLGGQFVDGDSRSILYRSIIMPLGEGDGRVSALIGGANCREVVSNDSLASS
jgi:hypothetical protein